MKSLTLMLLFVSFHALAGLELVVEQAPKKAAVKCDHKNCEVIQNGSRNTLKTSSEVIKLLEEFYQLEKEGEGPTPTFSHGNWNKKILITKDGKKFERVLRSMDNYQGKDLGKFSVYFSTLTKIEKAAGLKTLLKIK